MQPVKKFLIFVAAKMAKQFFALLVIVKIFHKFDGENVDDTPDLDRSC
jgi:hypothetical protein